jgi:hypothetical protein
MVKLIVFSNCFLEEHQNLSTECEIIMRKDTENKDQVSEPIQKGNINWFTALFCKEPEFKHKIIMRNNYYRTIVKFIFTYSNSYL